MEQKKSNWDEIENQVNKSYVYCPLCQKCWPGWNVENIVDAHPRHIGESTGYDGVYLQLNFVSPEEGQFLIEACDAMDWDLSQSGRRKQNFGPKVNFKKRKLKLGDFNGFPRFSKIVHDKFKNVDVMKDFRTVEQCALEYDPDKGASIDPHIDDCWIWGERVVSLSLLSDSVLTMTLFKGSLEKYNLSCCYDYINNFDRFFTEDRDIIVRIPMPSCSLLVLTGSARYAWEHCILRSDITTRRICLAYRELTPPYLEDGKLYAEGQDVLKQTEKYW